MYKSDICENAFARPFIKWAGGKTQLIKEISKNYPQQLGQSINKYAEPFVGGGAVFFDIVNYYDINEIYISDINKELILSYKSIKEDAEAVIELLKGFETEYLAIPYENRNKYYYKKREDFNNFREMFSEPEIAAHFIFLNKTCFNGLFRVNKQGLFNVPAGKYRNPLICDEKNLRIVSEKLKRVKIVCSDYKGSEDFIDNNTFVYIDPPYRPISYTSSFNSYSVNGFDDKAQVELSEFANRIHRKGAKIIISNSDPWNHDKKDDFFENIYKGYKIQRIEASRMINSKASLRGKITELLISNF